MQYADIYQDTTIPLKPPITYLSYKKAKHENNVLRPQLSKDSSKLEE